MENFAFGYEDHMNIVKPEFASNHSLKKYNIYFAALDKAKIYLNYQNMCLIT